MVRPVPMSGAMRILRLLDGSIETETDRVVPSARLDRRFSGVAPYVQPGQTDRSAGDPVGALNSASRELSHLSSASKGVRNSNSGA